MGVTQHLVTQHVFTRSCLGVCAGVDVHVVLHTWKLGVYGST